jgi:hypothetical protein
VAILCLTSCGGSPGVTTLAVGLALTWPRPVLLADCDPGAHQGVLAGYLSGRSAGGKGLLRVAEAHRDRRPLREVVLDQSLLLADSAGHRRLLLPGFTRPSSAAHFTGVWSDLAETFDRLDEVEMDVIVDLGRLGPLGLPPALAERSALTAVVLSSSLRAVMSARVHLPAVTGSGRSNGGNGLVLVDEGRPYRSREISRALGLPVLASIPRDDDSAAHFSDGAPRHRKFEGSAYLRAVRAATATFADELQRSSDLVRS